MLLYVYLTDVNLCISYRYNCMYILQVLLYVYFIDVTVCISYRFYCMYIYLTCPLDSAPLRRQPFLNFSEKEIYINKKSTTFMSILSLSLSIYLYIYLYSKYWHSKAWISRENRMNETWNRETKFSFGFSLSKIELTFSVSYYPDINYFS